uniref:Uncharacterized protein n=1 Tax=mine drainage metagenome TaxID=410659 RepID=E6PGZ8_9ZZZZ
MLTGFHISATRLSQYFSVFNNYGTYSWVTAPIILINGTARLVYSLNHVLRITAVAHPSTLSGKDNYAWVLSRFSRSISKMIESFSEVLFPSYNRTQLIDIVSLTSTSDSLRNSATKARCVRYKIILPRSQSPQVPGSTPHAPAASRIDHPLALRLARSISAMLLGSGNGL